MSDLVEFLRARLAEDEQVACCVEDEGYWEAEDEEGGRVVSPANRFRPVAEIRGEIVGVGVGNAHHIARHDPARVLREVESKRRIIDEHADDGGYCRTCTIEDRQENTLEEIRNDGPYMVTVQRPLPFPCPTLRLLALPYADHQDYREEWRP